MEKDAAGVCTIPKLFPHNLTKSPQVIDNHKSVAYHFDVYKVREPIGIQKPLLVEGKSEGEKEVSFRRLVKGIPSTTYATFALYRYPAKFIPQVIAYILTEYAYSGMTVFDPFAGYGTVGIVSKIYGYDYELWDLNPLLELLHAVATMEPRDIDVDKLVCQIDTCSGEYIPKWANLSYWFPQEFLPFLGKVWGFYHAVDEPWLKLLLAIPLLKTTRYFSYDDVQRQKLSRSPKAYSKINLLLASEWQDIFYKKLKENIKATLRGIHQYWKLAPKTVHATVKGGVDTLSMNLSKEKDILITSPPYLQAQEYIRQAKMDLFWLGYSESQLKELAKLEIPYRPLPPCPILSDTYSQFLDRITEAHLRMTFERYFWGVLGALTLLQEKISSYLFLFVGPATLRARPVPIATIFTEHFTSLGWKHEVTLRDTIVTRRMFFYRSNPATGLNDQRMRTESLIVLRRSR